MSESLEYDQVGNITIRNGLPYSYDVSYKHAVASYNGLAYSYDANGLVVGRGTRSIIYDAGNRPVQTDTGGDFPRAFAYDGDGKRLKRTDSVGSVRYVGAYEKNATTGETTKYYLASLDGSGRGRARPSTRTPWPGRSRPSRASSSPLRRLCPWHPASWPDRRHATGSGPNRRSATAYRLTVVLAGQ